MTYLHRQPTLCHIQKERVRMEVEIPLILGVWLAYAMWKNDNEGVENAEKEEKYAEKRDDGPWFF